jgi:hypothetical protein
MSWVLLSGEKLDPSDRLLDEFESMYYILTYHCYLQTENEIPKARKLELVRKYHSNEYAQKTMELQGIAVGFKTENVLTIPIIGYLIVLLREFHRPRLSGQDPSQAQAVSSIIAKSVKSCLESLGLMASVPGNLLKASDPRQWTVEEVVEWGRSRGLDEITVGKFRGRQN